MRHPIKEDVDFQSKDIFRRGLILGLGEKVTMTDGQLTFTAEGNDKWKGVATCYSCNENIRGDIIIEKGTITKIENLRKLVI